MLVTVIGAYMYKYMRTLILHNVCMRMYSQHSDTLSLADRDYETATDMQHPCNSDLHCTIDTQ
jgi:hypothetical protein